MANTKVKEQVWGLGRRKTSVARVRLAPGSGAVTVNRRPLNEFFPVERRRTDAVRPLEIAEAKDRYDVWVNVKGGGTTGQSAACALGIARALARVEPEIERTLRRAGLLTRDSRKVERKKYGHHKARRGCQFSKR